MKVRLGYIWNLNCGWRIRGVRASEEYRKRGSALGSRPTTVETCPLRVKAKGVAGIDGYALGAACDV